jgi:hypothetical protein
MGNCNCKTKSNQIDAEMVEIYKIFGIKEKDTYEYPSKTNCCWGFCSQPSDDPVPFTDATDEVEDPKPNHLTRDVCDYDGMNYDGLQ